LPVITKADLARYRVRRVEKYGRAKSAATILESEAAVPLETEFDIFLSHSYRDAKTLTADDLAEAKELLEDFGLSVYVDWLVDSDLDRNRVTAATAARIRERMRHAKSLLYATSQSSSESKWMPWELGYKDGDNGRVAILPILDLAADNFNGQEFLGLYPYLTKQNNTEGTPTLWIVTRDGRYVDLDSWLAGHDPYRHAAAG
jgi:hypothetical protein